MKKAAFFGFMVAAVVALVVVLASSSVTRKGVKVGVKSAEACNKDVPGECLPQIGYLDTNGTMWTSDMLDGQVVMVNFWATWCGPCKHEIPALTEVYKQHADNGFVLLGVLVDSDHVNDEQLARFAGEYNLDYPVVRVDPEIWWAFGEPRVLPTTFVYDRTGKLRAHERRALSEYELAGMVESLLAEK